jgi:hypothetical protein
MSEAVKVIVRARPMNSREKDHKIKSCVNVYTADGRVEIKDPAEPKKPPKAFTFDGAFGIESTSAQIYSTLCFRMVEAVLEGFNATFFAYGQTGCGKSFTMGGLKTPDEHRGVIPRAFEHIFDKAMTDASGNKYLIHISYIQIYNEEINDLLGDVKQKLELKEDPKRGVQIVGLSDHPVKSPEECEKTMDKGFANRAVGATLMNADSSRSHSIFVIHVDQNRKDGGSRNAMLNLVDLAGSERQGKTGATGERLKEATKINLSLSALGNVISALASGKGGHIPYRDSKLTRLLQSSLGGNTKTLMICAVSPAADSFDETLSTLRYANRAKNIKNKPHRNEDPKDAKLRALADEIQKLKDMIGGKAPLKPPPELAIALAPTAPVSEDQHPPDQHPAEPRGSGGATAAAAVAKQTAAEKKKMEEDYKKKVAEQEKETIRKLKEMEEKMEKEMKEMESKFVGGEKKDDTRAISKMLKMKEESEAHHKRMLLALKKGDDKAIVDTFMKLAHENQLTKEEVEKLVEEKNLAEMENNDLQTEFETEREDLIGTIRQLERDNQHLESILWKVQPLIPRDCNYFNLDRVRIQSQYDAERKIWRVPAIRFEKTKLPTIPTDPKSPDPKSPEPVTQKPVPTAVNLPLLTKTDDKAPTPAQAPVTPKAPAPAQAPVTPKAPATAQAPVTPKDKK